jgi:hypothetical protein
MMKANPTKSPCLRIGKSPALLGCLLLAGALAACSSVKTHVDKGALRGRSFSFLDTGLRKLPNYAEERNEAHAMVQKALINNLAAKGVDHVATGGAVTVAYLIVAGNNVATTSLNSYFGYSEDREELVNKVHKEQTGEDKGRGYFEAGTLVIDFVDPGTSKLLQRRSIHAQILRNLPLETRTARIQAIVDQALKDVRFSP